MSQQNAALDRQLWSVADSINNPLLNKSKLVYSSLISVDNRQINLPINITTIGNSVCLSFTSYSPYLASSASLRTKVQGELGA